MSNNPKSMHAHGYRIVFSGKGKTAKATRISVINKVYIEEQKFFSHMARLGFLLSRPNPNEPGTLVFRKKPKSQ